MKFYKDLKKKTFVTPANFKSRIEVWSVGFNFSSVLVYINIMNIILKKNIFIT